MQLNISRNQLRIALAIAAAIFIGLAAIVAVPVGLFSVFMHSMSSQMKAGQAVFNSLTPEKLKAWADRSERFWTITDKADYGMGVYDTGRKPIPAELAALKIIRIDIGKDYIEYVWLGGMDHTYLLIEKEMNGDLHFYAQYDESTRKDLGVITPNKTEPNQSPEPMPMAVTPPAAQASRQP